ncbi:glutamate synthase-related protein [candidate division KSB1 bacterium]
MALYECEICGYIFNESQEGTTWEDLPDDWTCPVCDADKTFFGMNEESAAEAPEPPAAPDAGTDVSAADDGLSEYLREYRRASDETESTFADIQQIADTGESIIEPMRTQRPVISWDDILFKGAQLAKIPLNKEETVTTQTIIGPKAKKPLVIETPVYITHMSFGALSREVKIAMAKGSAAVKTAMCSGEGGILPESLENSYKYIFEYVPHNYSVTEENLQRADAIEIKIGQSAKPGLGGHLPGNKVTAEIAAIRGFEEGKDIISPAHFDDILDKESLKEKVSWLRETSCGKPVGIKLAAGNIETDLEIVLFAEPDFITVDGRPGATGAAPKYIKSAASIPTLFALHRARKFLDESGTKDVSLVITGGLRTSADFARALALGADAVAIGTAAMIACGCQQYRVCHTGRCPVGIATQDPALRERLDIETSAKRLGNFLRVSTEELKEFARLTGNDDVHKMSIGDLCTTNSEISGFTDIEHV